MQLTVDFVEFLLFCSSTTKCHVSWIYFAVRVLTASLQRVAYEELLHSFLFFHRINWTELWALDFTVRDSGHLPALHSRRWGGLATVNVCKHNRIRLDYLIWYLVHISESRLLNALPMIELILFLFNILLSLKN